MREYVIRVRMSEDFIEEGVDAAADQQSLEDGTLPVVDLMDLRYEEGVTVTFEVRDI